MLLSDNLRGNDTAEVETGTCQRTYAGIVKDIADNVEAIERREFAWDTTIRDDMHGLFSDYNIDVLYELLRGRLASLSHDLRSCMYFESRELRPVLGTSILPYATMVYELLRLSPEKYPQRWAWIPKRRPSLVSVQPLTLAQLNFVSPSKPPTFRLRSMLDFARDIIQLNTAELCVEFAMGIMAETRLIWTLTGFEPIVTSELVIQRLSNLSNFYSRLTGIFGSAHLKPYAQEFLEYFATNKSLVAKYTEYFS